MKKIIVKRKISTVILMKKMKIMNKMNPLVAQLAIELHVSFANLSFG